MRLTADPEVEKFRAEFSAFLDAHLPSEAEATSRPRSSSDMPEWAAKWQRTLFDAGWLLPGNPPEYGGRNATLPQQLAYLEELAERRIYHSFNPQGLGIIAAGRDQRRAVGPPGQGHHPAARPVGDRVLA